MKQNLFVDRRSALPRWLVATLLSLLALSAVIIGVLSITNWNFARNPLASLIEAKIDRPVTINGDLRAWLLSSRPAITVERLVIGNPKNIEKGDFASIEKISLAVNLRELLKGGLVLETLAVDNPNVTLINNKDSNNFTFSGKDEAPQEQEEAGKDPAHEPPKLPAVRQFTLKGGDLHVRDAVRKLTFDGKVEASERGSPETEPFRLRGKGTLNGEQFALVFKGGPLANIRLDTPYEFDANVQAGKTEGSARGAFARPFDLASLSASLDIKGQNLAHLYYLTNLALPFSPPYQISADVQTSRQKVTVKKLNGKVGSSDLSGTLSVDITGKRPKLVADLKSKSLRLADLSPAFGKGIEENPETGASLDSVAPRELPPDKLLPTYRFEFDRLQGMDADVKLRAASIQTGKIPFTEVAIDLKLQDAVITLNPVIFSLPQGNLAATARIDAREKTAKNAIDLRFNNVNLEQFKGKDTSEAPLNGILHARVQLTGVGNSVHDVVTGATGKLGAVIPSGEVRQAFAELTGINVARGLGLVLTKDKKRMGVRCAVATMQINNGKAEIEQLVFDTDTVLIKGDGHVNLTEEKLDLEIEGKPKKIQLVRLRAPITVEGSLRKPKLGIDEGDAAKQVGIAAAVSALLTPLTAALAFIDPGLAKDANCAALLAAAEQMQNQPLDKPATRPAPPAPK